MEQLIVSFDPSTLFQCFSSIFVRTCRSFCEITSTAPCYRCRTAVQPTCIVPPDGRRRRTDAPHRCDADDCCGRGPGSMTRGLGGGRGRRGRRAGRGDGQGLTRENVDRHESGRSTRTTTTTTRGGGLFLIGTNVTAFLQPGGVDLSNTDPGSEADYDVNSTGNDPGGF